MCLDEDAASFFVGASSDVDVQYLFCEFFMLLFWGLETFYTLVLLSHSNAVSQFSIIFSNTSTSIIVHSALQRGIVACSATIILFIHFV